MLSRNDEIGVMATKPFGSGLRGALVLASAVCLFYFLRALLPGYGFGSDEPAIAVSALLGAIGLTLARTALVARLPSWREILPDLLALAAISAAHDATLNVWQVPRVWLDLLRFSTPGTVAAALIYIIGAIALQARNSRDFAPHEFLSLLCLPLLFNLVFALGADGLMAQLGHWVSLGLIADVGFGRAILVDIGRVIVLGSFVELLVIGLGFSKTGRLPRDVRLHGLLWLSALHAVVTPQLADIPQAVAAIPFAPMATAIIAAVLAQSGLWAFVFIASGLTIEAVAGRPPVFASARRQWRQGFTKGAVYGGVFAVLAILWSLCLLLQPYVQSPTVWLLLAPLAGIIVFPFVATLIGSADETPPFFGRLRRAYRDPRVYLRGIFIGLCLVAAADLNLPHVGGATRFLFFFAVGALAYAGIALLCDVAAIRFGERAKGVSPKLESWRVYALYLVLGGFVGGALGWYFDAGQIDVVAAKFKAYADLAYQHDGRPAAQFTIYALFSKWAMLDLGTIGGGVRLFYTESLSGVINWSIAAPLFSINFVILAAIFQNNLRPLKQLFSQEGLNGVVTQAVRVLRWGLWMAPVINTFLKMSPEPSWYNQDGAVRTAAAMFHQALSSPADFQAWSLAVFTGLLAYDWLRILIWCDHMGLRVATLVNLTFIGGDRLDEAAAGFAGHAARTRFIPEALRRFATWTPLLIPFYIPRGADWDKAWTGAERLQNMPMPPAVSGLVAAYEFAALLALGIALLVARNWLRSSGSRKGALALDAWRPTVPNARYTLSNGLIGTEILGDGRGFAQVFETARAGLPIDLTRRPIDPLHLRGTFFYVRDRISGDHWSLGFEPVRRMGANYRINELRPGVVEIANEVHAIETKMEMWLEENAAVEFRRISLINHSAEPRRLGLTSYQELALNELPIYLRDPDLNALHVETVFVPALNALLARNRLLRGWGNFAARRMSPEVFFHAVGLPATGAALEGYEDSRKRFRGNGDLRRPQGLEEGRPRKLDDDGLLYSFDPAASLSIGIDLPAHGRCELLFVNGHAENETAAAQILCSRLGMDNLPAEVLHQTFEKIRILEPRAGKSETYDFGFSADGRNFKLTPQSPRPWAHVIANAGGFGTIISNDGELHSFAGNERHNAVTPFVWESGTASLTGQAIYIVDSKSGEIFAPTFAPLRRRDARYKVVYEPGAATFRAEYAATEVEMTVFVPPDQPADLRLVTLRNRAAEPREFRIVSYFDLVMAEHLPESLGRIEFANAGASNALCFRYPVNNFVQGQGFAATSLAVQAKETFRPRFIGRGGRDLSDPCMVTGGSADRSLGDDGRRIAAFSSVVAVPAHGELEFALVLGETRTRAEALQAAQTLATTKTARASLAKTRQFWSDQVPPIWIETNQPHFDHLVNHWLHYQVLAARLWARGGPNQRGGAFGFRDQLQDVLPLVFSDASIARSQILLHAGQQFREGDVLKWWHRAPDGRTGLGQRSRASDPHLWLPYVVTRYIAATGDHTVLDERTAFLEGPVVPMHLDSLAFVPRASRADADLYEHCRLAIDLTLGRMGARGLPLMGTCDWNDGLDLVGFGGRGESVWLAFFLHEILGAFTPLIAAREGKAAAEPYRQRAEQLKADLECAWRGDHYVLAFADDGRELDVTSAMTAAWPVLSGAVDGARGAAALEEALGRLEKADRILLIDKPYTESSQPFPGRIADYPPGVRENGGQYSHGATWIVDAYIRLAELANAHGDAAAAARYKARAFTCWKKISPLDKTDGEALAIYGLAPYQQPADIYEGCGHSGHGGWSWYTGSAARMLSAAYEILGLRMRDGKISVADDLFEPKGDLVVKRAVIRGKVFSPSDARTNALYHA
jgi:cyclic beta-1,2-glucan synthetase